MKAACTWFISAQKFNITQLTAETMEI